MCSHYTKALAIHVHMVQSISISVSLFIDPRVVPNFVIIFAAGAFVDVLTALKHRQCVIPQTEGHLEQYAPSALEVLADMHGELAVDIAGNRVHAWLWNTHLALALQIGVNPKIFPEGCPNDTTLKSKTWERYKPT